MDFVLQRMISDVSAWYDLYYLGGATSREAHQAMLENAKQLHVSVLRSLYDPARFETPGDMEAERVALLTDTQQAVDVIRGTLD